MTQHESNTQGDTWREPTGNLSVSRFTCSEHGKVNPVPICPHCRSKERAEGERRYEPIVEWARGVVEGTAFSGETGQIWKHWLEEGERLLATLPADSTEDSLRTVGGKETV